MPRRFYAPDYAPTRAARHTPLHEARKYVRVRGERRRLHGRRARIPTHYANEHDKRPSATDRQAEKHSPCEQHRMDVQYLQARMRPYMRTKQFEAIGASSLKKMISALESRKSRKNNGQIREMDGESVCRRAARLSQGKDVSCSWYMFVVS